VNPRPGLAAAVLRRVAATLPLLLGVTLIGFLLTDRIGPDAVWELASRNVTVGQLEELERQLDRDRPLALRYLSYLGDLARLDFGHSLISGEPVGRMLARSLPVTLALMLPGLLLGFAVALGLAFAAAVWRGTWVDRLIAGLSAAGMSLSLVILVMLVQSLFAVHLGWFPARGWSSESLSAYLRFIALPTLTLVLINLGYNVRFFRASFIDALAHPSVVAARAYGLPAWRIVARRVLPSAAPPILTRMIFALPMVLVAGSLVIESHFGVPGAGRVLFNALLSGDQPVLLALVVVSGLLVVLAVMLVDLAMAWIDPRVRRR